MPSERKPKVRDTGDVPDMSEGFNKAFAMLTPEQRKFWAERLVGPPKSPKDYEGQVIPDLDDDGPSKPAGPESFGPPAGAAAPAMEKAKPKKKRVKFIRDADGGYIGAELED